MRACQRGNGNKSETARQLGLMRVGFLKKLKRCEEALGAIDSGRSDADSTPRTT